MLKTLYIKNYALIDNLEIDFESGFSVITGETGAGKSIILGALSLIVGQRADTKSIKDGADKCIIEGTFDVSAYDLKSFCDEKDIEYDEHSYILRRELYANGKSRAFINDSPATLTDLKELGSQLIDIHSQHQNLLLSDDHFQMQVVDILAKNTDLLKQYQSAYKTYQQLEKKLDALIETTRKNKEEEDYIRFQYDTLRGAALVDGEQEELEEEQQLLSHAEEIKTGLYKCYQLLADDERSVVLLLKDALASIRAIQKVYPAADQMSERLDSAYVDLKDLSAEIWRSAEGVDFDPARLEIVNARLELIYDLQKKYKASSIHELLATYKDFENKIGDLNSYEEQIEAVEKDVALSREKVEALAKKLSSQRKKAGTEIEKVLIDKIAVLGMPNVRFQCEITEKDNLDITGCDRLEFLFSANKNIALQPVAAIASGGEISRLMLCLKSMIAGATALPTIIFDEIDTGVSGEIADKMGQIMLEFGAKMQVIVITHLPQIAAKGSMHYKVYKQDSEHATTTNLRRLTHDERLTEIAGMLSGSHITEAAIQNAKVMLESKSK